MDYLKAFLVGGALCLIGQLLIDKTKLSPARILVGYVVCGVLLGALGVYEPLVKFAGAGASVPLTGFGYTLANGVKKSRHGGRPAGDLRRRTEGHSLRYHRRHRSRAGGQPDFQTEG